MECLNQSVFGNTCDDELIRSPDRPVASVASVASVAKFAGDDPAPASLIARVTGTWGEAHRSKYPWKRVAELIDTAELGSITKVSAD